MVMVMVMVMVRVRTYSSAGALDSFVISSNFLNSGAAIETSVQLSDVLPEPPAASVLLPSSSARRSKLSVGGAAGKGGALPALSPLAALPTLVLLAVRPRVTSVLAVTRLEPFVL